MWGKLKRFHHGKSDTDSPRVAARSQGGIVIVVVLPVTVARWRSSQDSPRRSTHRVKRRHRRPARNPASRPSDPSGRERVQLCLRQLFLRRRLFCGRSLHLWRFAGRKFMPTGRLPSRCGLRPAGILLTVPRILRQFCGSRFGKIVARILLPQIRRRLHQRRGLPATTGVVGRLLRVRYDDKRLGLHEVLHPVTAHDRWKP